jgi:hypothetical protein
MSQSRRWAKWGHPPSRPASAEKDVRDLMVNAVEYCFGLVNRSGNTELLGLDSTMR